MRPVYHFGLGVIAGFLIGAFIMLLICRNGTDSIAKHATTAIENWKDASDRWQSAAEAWQARAEQCEHEKLTTYTRWAPDPSVSIKAAEVIEERAK